MGNSKAFLLWEWLALICDAKLYFGSTEKGSELGDGGWREGGRGSLIRWCPQTRWVVSAGRGTELERRGWIGRVTETDWTGWVDLWNILVQESEACWDDCSVSGWKTVDGVSGEDWCGTGERRERSEPGDFSTVKSDFYPHLLVHHSFYHPQRRNEVSRAFTMLGRFILIWQDRQ